jgi:tRNA pseudouridine55 synthase
MATGVMVLGVGRGTRLLGHLSGLDKDYRATVRLGAASTTDDAEGEVTTMAPAGAVANLSEAEVMTAITGLRGEIDQVPSSVSAIKVAGRRAYSLVRSGEQVKLAPRRVTVSRFEVLALRRVGAAAGDGCGADPAGFLDIDIEVTVSSGTYVRALARDLGAALGVGGHLTALCRTRVGPFQLAAARTLADLADDLSVIPLAQAAAARFATVAVTAEQAKALALGQFVVMPSVAGATPAGGLAGPHPGAAREPRPVADAAGLVAALDPDGALIALVAPVAQSARWRPMAVFATPIPVASGAGGPSAPA